MNEKNARKLIEQMRENPKNISFNDLWKLCIHCFGEPRQKGTSHMIYKTPWQGYPRVNIQNSKVKAKSYQVKQVLLSIEKLEVKK